MASVHGCSVGAWIILAIVFCGCDAFEYYGPLPNLRNKVDFPVEQASEQECLTLKRQVLSREDALELRLINRLSNLCIEDCELSDAVTMMHSIAGLSRLEGLSLRRVNLIDADLEGLAASVSLRSLELLATEVDGEGLWALTKLPIRSLKLHSTTATGETLQSLAGFEQLEKLELCIPDLQVANLPSLSKLSRLTSINIVLGDFSDSDGDTFAFLSGLPNLRTISLSSMSVDDDTLRSIGQLETLETFELSLNSITDAGIVALEPLRELKNLCIWSASDLTGKSIVSAATHPKLETISFVGARILYAETHILDALPNLRNKEVGMSRREIAEINGQQFFADRINRRSDRMEEGESNLDVFRESLKTGRRRLASNRPFPSQTEAN